MPTWGSPLQGDRDLVTAQHGRGDRRGGRSCHGSAVALHNSSRHPSGTVSSVVGRSPPVKPTAPVPGSQRRCLLLFFPALDASWDPSALCLSKRCLPLLQICKDGVWMKICRLALSRPLVAPLGHSSGGGVWGAFSSHSGVIPWAPLSCRPYLRPQNSSIPLQLSLHSHPPDKPYSRQGWGDFEGLPSVTLR